MIQIPQSSNNKGKYANNSKKQSKTSSKDKRPVPVKYGLGCPV